MLFSSSPLVICCHITDTLWAKAGWGGDQCICHTLGQEVIAFLKKAQHLISTIERTMLALNRANKVWYVKSVNQTRYSAWRANDTRARVLAETITQQMASYSKELGALLEEVEVPALQGEKRPLEKMSSCSRRLTVKKKACASYKCKKRKRKKMEKESIPYTQEQKLPFLDGQANLTLTVDMLQAIQSSPGENSSLKFSKADFQKFVDTLAAKPRWYQFGLRIRHRFVRKAAPIFKKYYDTVIVRKEVLPCDTKTGKPLYKELSKLKEETTQANNTLWWLFYSYTKTFLMKWIKLVDSFLKKDGFSVENLTYTPKKSADFNDKGYVSENQKNDYASETKLLKQEIPQIRAQITKIRANTAYLRSTTCKLREIAHSLTTSSNKPNNL